MKRFTVMLPETLIAKIKKAEYSPSKKRVIIQTVLEHIFFQLEQIEYPEKIEISIRINAHEYK